MGVRGSTLPTSCELLAPAGCPTRSPTRVSSVQCVSLSGVSGLPTALAPPAVGTTAPTELAWPVWPTADCGEPRAPVAAAPCAACWHTTSRAGRPGNWSIPLGSDPKLTGTESLSGCWVGARAATSSLAGTSSRSGAAAVEWLPARGGVTTTGAGADVKRSAGWTPRDCPASPGPRAVSAGFAACSAARAAKDCFSQGPGHSVRTGTCSPSRGCVGSVPNRGSGIDRLRSTTGRTSTARVGCPSTARGATVVGDKPADFHSGSLPR
mmetsp:Transcript_20586/g.52322  ORF Transcript_20586/g.52322 Transcript_20586/m.52322 type:complete len:266 (+) Transcript_20586:1483-2280(+)